MTDHPADAFGSSHPGFGGVPVGAVMAFAGPTVTGPGGSTASIEAQGWMACDG